MIIISMLEDQYHVYGAEINQECQGCPESGNARWIAETIRTRLQIPANSISKYLLSLKS